MRHWGITGTNGKTTAAWILAEFLDAAPGRKCGCITTVEVFDAARAAWLNSCAGGKATVSGAAAGLSQDDFDRAYLLNLDITGEYSHSFRIKDIDIDRKADTVMIDVELVRTGKIAQAINGKLKFYGAATLEAFRDPALEPLGDVRIGDDDFAEGDTATAEIKIGGDTPPAFFKATIE